MGGFLAFLYSALQYEQNSIDFPHLFDVIKKHVMDLACHITMLKPLMVAKNKSKSSVLITAHTKKTC